jgi:hypothetical protein
MAARADRPAAQQPNEQPKSSPNTSGRETNGRFAVGNRGGPGNPFARRVAALRSAFIAAVTPEDLQRICQRMVTMASLGDLQAAKLVLGYVLGKIPEPVNPDTLDQDECKQAAQNPTMDEVARVAQQRPAADLAVPFLRAQDVVNGARFGQIAQDLIDGKPPVVEFDDEEAPEDEAVAEEMETYEDSTVTEGAKRSVGEGQTAACPPSPKPANGRTARANPARCAAPPSMNGENGRQKQADGPYPRRSS